MNIAPNGKSAQTLGRLLLRLNLRCEYLRYRLNPLTLAGIHNLYSSAGSIARIGIRNSNVTTDPGVVTILRLSSFFTFLSTQFSREERPERNQQIGLRGML